MENNMQTEESIELGKLMQILYDRRKTVGAIVSGCTITAALVAFTLPKTYISTSMVQMRSVGKNMGGAAALSELVGNFAGGSSSTTSPSSYIELMKSRAVLEPVIDSLEWENEKSKPDAKSFSGALKIENIKQTNIINVQATAGTPEKAQKISQGVVDSFLAMQTNMNKQTQSLLVKFLNERITAAKAESEEAAAKLAAYSKEHKIYAPDEQAQLAMTQLNAYDKAISDVMVEGKSAQAEYDTATAKLREQKAGSRAYHINDNSAVQAIRQSIVEKQVELVGYQEQFTDEHPQVKQAKIQLADLNRMLINEVNAIIDSNATTINSAQMEMLKNQAVAEAKISASRASEAAIKEKKAEKEAEMDKFPDDAMNYMMLKSDAEVKQKVYLSLVQECEQDKVQEAMESMDIQVIDPANLPDEDKPAGPRKKLITAIGFFIGCIISVGYGLLCYKREEA